MGATMSAAMTPPPPRTTPQAQPGVPGKRIGHGMIPPVPPMNPADADVKDHGGTSNAALDEHLNTRLNLHGGPLHPYTGTFLHGRYQGKTPGQAREIEVANFHKGDRGPTDGSMTSGMGGGWLHGGKNPPAMNPADISPATSKPAQAAPAAVAQAPAAPMQGPTPSGKTLDTVPPSPILSPAQPDAAAIPGQLARGATVGVAFNGNRTISGPYGGGSSRTGPALSPASGVYVDGKKWNPANPEPAAIAATPKTSAPMAKTRTQADGTIIAGDVPDDYVSPPIGTKGDPFDKRPAAVALNPAESDPNEAEPDADGDDVKKRKALAGGQ